MIEGISLREEGEIGFDKCPLEGQYITCGHEKCPYPTENERISKCKKYECLIEGVTFR